MLVQPLKYGPRACAVAFLAAGALFAADVAANAGAFSSLAGYWLGSGVISMKDGTRERIRCKASYAVSPAGNALNQSLLCASDSYKFDVRSDVTESGGVMTGGWSETTRNATGQLSGRVAGPRIQANVSGVGFTAGISITTRGRSQSVSIVPSGGTDVVGVTVTMRKE